MAASAGSAADTEIEHRQQPAEQAAVATSTATYTSGGQIGALNHTWSGASLNLAYTDNQDHQRTGVTASDRSFLPSGLPAGSTTYATNALNQYTTVNATAFTYDNRGNLSSDGVWSYGYDTENRLVMLEARLRHDATKTGSTVAYVYDALDRRRQKTVNGTTTVWASFGNQEIAEYAGTTTLYLTQRDVYGSGLDEPVAMIAGSSGVPATRRSRRLSAAPAATAAPGNSNGQPRRGGWPCSRVGDGKSRQAAG